MRRLALISALLLAGSVFAVGQSGGNNTPPGGDLVGSDRATTSAGTSSTRSRDTEQNQRMTGTTGSTKGPTGSPAFSGSSVYGNTAAQSGAGVKGKAGTTSATAGRQRAYGQHSSVNDTGVEDETSVIPAGRGGAAAATRSSSRQPNPNGKRHRRRTQPPK